MPTSMPASGVGGHCEPDERADSCTDEHIYVDADDRTPISAPRLAQLQCFEPGTSKEHSNNRNKLVADIQSYERAMANGTP